MQNVNRALDGDVVAVEILPKQQWLTGQEEVRREGGREGGREGRVDEDVVAVEILPKQQWLTGQEEVRREGGREERQSLLRISHSNILLSFSHSPYLSFFSSFLFHSLPYHYHQLTLQEGEEAAETAQEGEARAEGEGGEEDTPSNYEGLIPAPVVQAPASSSSSFSSVRPTGRVVGVIKRYVSQYPPSLPPSLPPPLFFPTPPLPCYEERPQHLP